ncbi:hypothetical protein [Methanoculleus chikugoensis]|uniref:hypothetical protein n=1 Tax=Methanoculleus chikugoensis TaxID=118126 RepID=UPI001FB487F9|nr:hypothetical protein [Methanoculleus chikugoensis]
MWGGIAVSFAVGVAVTVTVGGVAVGLVVGQGVFVAVGVTGVPSEELLLLLPPPDDDEDHAQPPELRVSTTFENIPKIAFTILGPPGSPSASTVLFSAASVVLSIVRETIASFTITEFISAESFNLPPFQTRQCVKNACSQGEDENDSSDDLRFFHDYNPPIRLVFQQIRSRIYFAVDTCSKIYMFPGDHRT